MQTSDPDDRGPGDTTGGDTSSGAAAPALAAPAAALRDHLRDALVDSRQRWRDLVTVAADIAFETDADGRFSFVAPDQPLGWNAARLIGRPAESLLADGRSGAAFNPFRPVQQMRRRNCWLKQPDGTPVCLAFAVAPLVDEAGQVIGARGLGIDITEQNRYDLAAAMALRRAEVLDHILWHIRREVLAPRMMRAALDALMHAVGADGAGVLDPGAAADHQVQHQSGEPIESVLDAAIDLLGRMGGEAGEFVTAGGHKLLAFPGTTRFGGRSGLVLWRQPGGRPWESEDRIIAESATGVIRMILEHDSLQREMQLQARTDPLTGLLNRRAFLDEVTRRIDRLERDTMPGTLMFIDLDHFKRLNDLAGHDTGDEALCAASALLSRAVRPTDVVARLGGDEFAVWLDGTDELAAAERAERLCEAAPRELAGLGATSGVQLSMSIGIACRWPGSEDDMDSLLRRADGAMYEVKRAGRGKWRVAKPPGDGEAPEPPPPGRHRPL